MSTAELLDRILVQRGDLRARCPELRFGQLVAIIGELARDETGHSLRISAAKRPGSRAWNDG